MRYIVPRLTLDTQTQILNKSIAMDEKHLSTTALAKSIGKEAKELFILLARGGWIVKVEGRWQLTEKGRFEGGITINHPKFGEYIAWPESIKQHALLSLLPEAPLTATNLGQKLRMPARVINLMLAELGWIAKGLKGWTLTQQGRRQGGQQHESEKTGIPYVTWPEALLDNPYLLASVEALSLLQPEGAQTGECLAGYRVHSNAVRMIGNWLYLAEIPHAYQRRLPIAQELYADFYLPQGQVYIEFWGDATSSGELKTKLVKQEIYQQQEFALIEVERADLEHLDEVLPRLLLKYGIAVY